MPRKGQLKDFSVCSRGHNKVRPSPEARFRCLVCNAARIRAKKYGVSLEVALAIPDFCESCGKPKKLTMDHDHYTGEFRGWLCLECNKGIGCFNDSAEQMMLGVQYLLRHQRN